MQEVPREFEHIPYSASASAYTFVEMLENGWRTTQTIWERDTKIPHDVGLAALTTRHFQALKNLINENVVLNRSQQESINDMITELARQPGIEASMASGVVALRVLPIATYINTLPKHP